MTDMVEIAAPGPKDGADPKSAGRGKHSNKHGIITVLADLPESSIVSEEALARILDRHQVSIKRAVDRGELPPPIRLLGAPVWTVGSILRHIEDRLESAKKEAASTAHRFRNLEP